MLSSSKIITNSSCLTNRSLTFVLKIFRDIMMQQTSTLSNTTSSKFTGEEHHHILYLIFSSANYLKDPALGQVKSMKYWHHVGRLKYSYGAVKMMLIKKLNNISNMDNLGSTKDLEAIALSLSKIITKMKEIIHLAKEHLYFSNGLPRIYSLLDEPRLTRWLRTIADEDKPERQWSRLVIYLVDEQKLQQQKINIFVAHPNHLSLNLRIHPERTHFKKVDITLVIIPTHWLQHQNALSVTIKMVI